MNVLILGGTASARALAAACVAAGLQVTSSLAGRVTDPKLPVGDVRIGGFGGSSGMRDWLLAHQIQAVVDATHPFAEQITSNAQTACADAGVPLAQLIRPSWRDLPGADSWHWVTDHAAAAQRTAAIAQRPFLTVGRQRLASFTPLESRYCLVRVVEPCPIPASWELLISRGPYALESELKIMQDRAVDCLVTKDSGGDYTVAKLAAATQLGLPIVIVGRAAAPSGVQFTTPEAALAWLQQMG